MTGIRNPTLAVAVGLSSEKSLDLLTSFNSLLGRHNQRRSQLHPLVDC
jgi:hypothetical protein